MSEDEILAQVRNARKLSDIFPDYPCDKCDRDKKSCSSWRECPAWSGWFRRRFAEIKKSFGVKG